MIARVGVPLAAMLVLVACEQPRGVGFGPESYGPAIPEGAEVTVFELPGVRPIPAYSASGISNPEDIVAFGGASLADPEANLVVETGGRQVLMRQINVGGQGYVVVQGTLPTSGVSSEILTRTGCLLEGLPTSVRGVRTAPEATVYTLDCA